MIKALQKAAPVWITAWGFALGLSAFVGWVAGLVISVPISLDSAGISVAIAFVVLIYSGTALHLLLALSREDFARPRLRVYRKQAEGLPAIFLFSPADWLSYKAAYTMFVLEEDGFERFLGVAHVFNVQNDRCVQVVVPERAKGADKVWSSLDSESRDYFKSIVLKPGVPIDG